MTAMKIMSNNGSKNNVAVSQSDKQREQLMLRIIKSSGKVVSLKLVQHLEVHKKHSLLFCSKRVIFTHFTCFPSLVFIFLFTWMHLKVDGVRILLSGDSCDLKF